MKQPAIDPMTPGSRIPDILFEDEHLLAINKPAGLLSIPDGYDPSLPYVTGVLAPAFGRLWIVHRLDRETSGLMLLAKDAASHRDLNLQFEQRLVSKTYHALVVGLPQWDQFQMESPLLVNADRKHRTRVSLTLGKPARTDFHVLRRFSQACLVEAHPYTGYTHQIRAHLADLGFPILQDSLYANYPATQAKNLSGPKLLDGLIDRVALHASTLVCSHPFSHEPLRLEAPYPSDFLSALQRLQ